MYKLAVTIFFLVLYLRFSLYTNTRANSYLERWISLSWCVMARASSPFREEEASNRWSMYCCSSSDILPKVPGVGVMQKVLTEVGEPASSMGCTDCRLPGGVVPAPAKQPGGSWGLGTDLLLLAVDEVGLLDWERMEWDDEGKGAGFSRVDTVSPVRQPTDTSRGTSSSFCGGVEWNMILTSLQTHASVNYV